VRGQGGYERTRDLLTERGFEEDDATFNADAFGSWVISVSHTPRLRVVWDGKDEWAIIQAELNGNVQDLWIGKRSEDVTPDAMVQALERLRDYATEARRKPL
jgi:hypothetical protein